VRELAVEDTSLLTYEDAQKRGEAELKKNVIIESAKLTTKASDVRVGDYVYVEPLHRNYLVVDKELNIRSPQTAEEKLTLNAKESLGTMIRA